MQSLKACMISLFNRLLFDIIHARYLLECFITILPGILLGIIYRTPLFFMASFLAIASIMPYNKSYNKKYLTLLSLLFISLFSFVFAHQPHQGSDLYWLCLLAISPYLWLLRSASAAVEKFILLALYWHVIWHNSVWSLWC